MTKRFFLPWLLAWTLLASTVLLGAEAANSAPTPNPNDHTAVNNATAAAVSSGQVTIHPPDLLEHLVDSVLELFDIKSTGNTTAHYVISASFLVLAFLLRRVVTGIVFNQLKKLAARTTTTLDDKLFPALESPAATFVFVLGVFAALKVLKLSEQSDHYIDVGSTVVFSLVIFWALLRAFNAVLEHAHEIAINRQMGVAAFMPWIKKTLVTIFIVLGVLIVIQNLGYGSKVSALLAGLGIGGLAFALAAQDTIANLFGSIVVAIDQPFKIGEAVKIGSSEGVVEDIGLRSTKLRPPGKNLIIIPNKTVAGEAIINNSRFIARRVEQVLGLTYDATADELDKIVKEIRALILREDEVAPKSVMVYFRDFNASSLDIWLVYETKDPDFQKQMSLRQRINFGIMRLVEAHGQSFAFPTQVMHLDGPVAKQLAGLTGSTPPTPPQS